MADEDQKPGSFPLRKRGGEGYILSMGAEQKKKKKILKSGLVSMELIYKIV